jgi:regulator of nucleoside diphosphate kinase
MSSNMKSRKITLTFSDYIHLQDLLRSARQFGFQPSVLVDALEAELNRAEVVTSSAVPGHVFTMNTCAQLTDTSTGECSEYTLVFPGEANPQQGKLSVLSELGVALLGFSVGDAVEWESPDGPRSARIDQFSFQPEAAKQCAI